MGECLLCGSFTAKKYCNDSCKTRYFQKKREERINNLSPDAHIKEILNDRSLLGKFYVLKAIIRSQERKINNQNKIIDYLGAKAYGKRYEPRNLHSNNRIKSKGLCCMASRTNRRKGKV